jgi:hypothetical protein
MECKVSVKFAIFFNVHFLCGMVLSGLRGGPSEKKKKIKKKNRKIQN